MVTLKNNIHSFEIDVPEELRFTQSSINTEFKSSKRTLGIDGVDVVLRPDIVIA